jgi:hypothetical protein
MLRFHAAAAFSADRERKRRGYGEKCRVDVPRLDFELEIPMSSPATPPPDPAATAAGFEPAATVRPPARPLKQ